MNKELPKIIMIGAFPPPIHGMAMINSAVQEHLEKIGSTPTVINLAASSLSKSFFTKLKRMYRVFVGLIQFMCMKDLQNKILYMSISGRFGQIYEILFLLVARLQKIRIFLHHHAFTYLEEYSLLTQMLFKVSGNCTHITLCSGMASQLKALYPGKYTVISVSNIVHFLNEISSVPRTQLQTIGFLSNISEEKGVFEFLDLVKLCEENNLPIKAKLAGPFQDKETELKVKDRLKALHTIECIGPQYGKNKELFFNSIDVLIFPSHNEAEPLIIHEVMQHGIPVITYNHGCISEIVDAKYGYVIASHEEFVSLALKQIKEWLAHLDKFQAASIATKIQFNYLYQSNIDCWNRLIANFFEKEISI
ncbi:glycosyltransferase family 4 protein [Candidatus Nitrosacidococcus sp. I8]|uniref:glycosyltransferase family 4 protein n=1 Tax=Candidatus Nitrosacidococcus sp. I8 TaxID=2942908 RepID=UPI002225FA51|nr:glycosyltransferase family 4 protein [Candidatus Nitrosacidococcus sp. I8]CAH9018347.1 hypothetical protein NURINAE_00873 [Candidatus Nitrosacidococcus sp. I8]